MSLKVVHDFSGIRELLSQEIDVARHRHIFVFAGDIIWQKQALKEILYGYEEASLWVGEDAPEIYPDVAVKKAHSWLGREKKVVIFDANKDFSVDSFAAISGVVVGGGLFILLMPEEESWNKYFNTYFKKRIIKSIKSSKVISVVRQNNKEINFVADAYLNSEKENCEYPFLTCDQQNTVSVIDKNINEENKVPVVITSDRGRGKSAALGILAARLIQTGIKRIIITAPRMRATDIIFKHIKILLPEAEVTRGQVTFNKSIIQFYSPDQLSTGALNEENKHADLLLIDEAASIPVPLLKSFLNNFSQCVFATTVHGYEGTGRGFSVRFNKVLDKCFPGWLKLKMKTPVRWAENDPLEQWMFNLLCLDAEIVNKNSISKIEKNNLEISVVSQKLLANNETLLKELFSLLVIAHYRTRPSDLQRLLDDDDLSIYIATSDQHVIAVALVTHEGKFSHELSSEVYRGNRRPSGHLLAQALTYHCGIEHAAVLNYSRIMRIAVHPEFQEQGVGTKLLEFIVSDEQKQGRDAIGTSFGLNLRLLNFWRSAGFEVMRIGFQREQTSGEHAAIMLKPLSEAGEKVYALAYKRFNEQLLYWFDDVLHDLPIEIKEIFKVRRNEKDFNLSSYDKQDIQSFIKYSRNYELCIAALNKLVILNQPIINSEKFPYELKMILIEKIKEKKSWKKIAEEMNLNGKAASRDVFKKAITQLLREY